jgi:hypothetical protein
MGRGLIFGIALAVGLSMMSCVSGSAGGRERGFFGRELGRADSFEIGWYNSLSDLEGPAWIRSLGFDFSMPYVGPGEAEEIEAYLSRAGVAGIGVYLEIPRALATARGKALSDYIARYRDTSFLRGWYLYDEPEWKLAARPGRLGLAYRELKDLDPGRPVSLVFMFLGLSAQYREAMDRLWFDYYPITAGSREFEAIGRGRYADKVLAAGAMARRLHKPLFLVLQGFGESLAGKAQFGRRLPSAAETRYEFHASLLAQPASLAYWTLYRSSPAWVEGVLSPIVREFRGRFPDGIVYRSSEGLAIRGSSCDSILLDNGKGRVWLLLVSREEKEKTTSVELPEGWTFSLGGTRIEIEMEAHGSLLAEVQEGRGS